MIIHELEPLNAESARSDLADGPITPVDAFYVRNHGPVPDGDGHTWRLRVFGLVDRDLELTVDDLKSGRFEQHELVATLQCAGNRRDGLIAVRDIPGEAPWGPGATGTAEWRGVRLADVLAAARPTNAATDVAFVGADQCEGADPPQLYGASIPLLKAQRPEVLLAWQMNGAPLEPVHGAPLRVVVPGHIGARSVKWLDSIEVRADPWDGYYQRVAYRLLPAEGAPGPDHGMSLGEIAVNSDVLVPGDGATVEAGFVEVRGYAFAGGERYVGRVDVSTDGGRSWIQAELLDDLGRWAWRLWQVQVELDPGEHEIVVRAWDSAAAAQPEDPATLWNPKGYVNNAWSRTRVTAVADGLRVAQDGVG